MYVKLKSTNNQVDPHFANDFGKSLMMEVEQILLDLLVLLILLSFFQNIKITYHTKWAKQS